jgi:hypothetical protein
MDIIALAIKISILPLVSVVTNQLLDIRRHSFPIFRPVTTRDRRKFRDARQHSSNKLNRINPAITAVIDGGLFSLPRPSGGVWFFLWRSKERTKASRGAYIRKSNPMSKTDHVVQDTADIDTQLRMPMPVAWRDCFGHICVRKYSLAMTVECGGY